MRFIAHRANLYSKDISRENKIDAIHECLNLHLDVEIDIWYYNNTFYLGHDEPSTPLDIELLYNPSIWIHCKNDSALFELQQYHDCNFFWHQTDKYALTAKGFIWTFPNNSLSQNSICVLPEQGLYTVDNLKFCYGICSDNILYYKQLLS